MIKHNGPDFRFWKKDHYFSHLKNFVCNLRLTTTGTFLVFVFAAATSSVDNDLERKNCQSICTEEKIQCQLYQYNNWWGGKAKDTPTYFWGKIIFAGRIILILTLISFRLPNLAKSVFKREFQGRQKK